jgi:hypothetical protein
MNMEPNDLKIGICSEVCRRIGNTHGEDFDSISRHPCCAAIFLTWYLGGMISNGGIEMLSEIDMFRRDPDLKISIAAFRKASLHASALVLEEVVEFIPREMQSRDSAIDRMLNAEPTFLWDLNMRIWNETERMEIQLLEFIRLHEVELSKCCANLSEILQMS